MSAPMYQFRPGGFEDDEDSDEDGFYLDSISQDELAHKKFSSVIKISEIGIILPELEECFLCNSPQSPFGPRLFFNSPVQSTTALI